MTNIIEITENAANQIKVACQEESASENSKLRVSVVGGGCSGFSYKLSFVEEAQENDMIIEQHDVKLIVDPKSALYLTGTQLHYSGGLNGKGFEFSNPNATRTCGCGSSFSV